MADTLSEFLSQSFRDLTPALDKGAGFQRYGRSFNVVWCRCILELDRVILDRVGVIVPDQVRTRFGCLALASQRCVAFCVFIDSVRHFKPHNLIENAVYHPIDCKQALSVAPLVGLKSSKVFLLLLDVQSVLPAVVLVTVPATAAIHF